MFLVRHRRAALAALLLVLGASCKSIASKDWNLRQLHDDATRHRYHGVLQSDLEFFLRHDVAGVFRGAGARIAEKSAGAIEDPAQHCLENVLDLADYAPRTTREHALRVEWFARLAVDDPGRLTRERATLALGPIGAALEVGVPARLPKDAVPAQPATVADAASALVRSVRGRIDPGSLDGKPAPTVDAACGLLEALVLDRDGARRALNAVGQLSALRGLSTAEAARLASTARELQRRLVRQTLAIALEDDAPIVRAAAVEAIVTCAGTGVLDGMLQNLGRESSADVLQRVLRLVRERGLPPAPEGLPEAERARWCGLQLRAIYALLVQRAEPDVHVAAMLVLSRHAGAGFESLREEDWQAWFRAQDAAREATKPTSS